MGQFEKKVRNDIKAKKERDKLRDLAVEEFETVEKLMRGVRYIEIFGQLMMLKPFIEWMKEHIEIHDQIDEENKQIKTLVMVKNIDEESRQKSDEQNIVRCPGCGVSFDSNAETSGIVLATRMPE